MDGTKRWLTLLGLTMVCGILAAAPALAASPGLCPAQSAAGGSAVTSAPTLDDLLGLGARVPNDGQADEGIAGDAAGAQACEGLTPCDTLDGTPCNPPTPNMRCFSDGRLCGYCACLSTGFWTCTQ